jgi:hypothetical protein
MSLGVKLVSAFDSPHICLSNIPEKEEASVVSLHVFKKKKTVFKDDILISRRDTDRLRRYVRENFVSIPASKT